MAILLLILLLPLFILFLLRNQRRMTLPPGPPGLPFVGNLLQLDKSAPHLYLWRLSKQYGSLMFLRLGFVPTLVVSSARMAKEVMKTHDHEFSGRPPLLGLQKLSYNGLDVAFSRNSHYWREMRKICVLHLFSSIRVQSFRQIREDEVLGMIKKISQSASSSRLTNLSEILISLTSTIISRVAFSKRYDDEGNERRRFQELTDEAQAVLGGFYVSDYFPLMGRWVDKLTGCIAEVEKTFKELDLFYQEIIDEHRDPNRPEPEQEDIIDVLLKLQKNPVFAVDLTFDHIKAILMDIFLAGTDTSAATVVWAMTMLMKSPSAMEKAQEELRHSIRDRGFVDEDDLEKLPYLKAIVKEAMRLYPAIVLVPRETVEKCVMEGYEIPPNTLVYVNAWAIGREPEFWENPEEFMPERFLGTSINFKGRDYQFIPFGGGRRICPGLYLGAVMVEHTLANLLYSFDWEMPAGMSSDDIDTHSKPGITMDKKNVLCLLARIHNK